MFWLTNCVERFRVDPCAHEKLLGCRRVVDVAKLLCVLNPVDAGLFGLHFSPDSTPCSRAAAKRAVLEVHHRFQFSLFHLLSFDHISDYHRPGCAPSWEEMVRSQIKSDGRSHWMHFYSENELHQVFGAGMGFSDVRVTKVGTAFSVAVSNAPRVPARQEASQVALRAQLDVLQKQNAALVSALNRPRGSLSPRCGVSRQEANGRQGGGTRGHRPLCVEGSHVTSTSKACATGMREPDRHASRSPQVGATLDVRSR